MISSPVGTPLVRLLESAEDLQAAAGLYREVFNYSDSEAGVNPRLLKSLQENGGSVVGAKDQNGNVVAFAYGFAAIADGTVFHYSQAAVIRPDYQGFGIGRALKQKQADVARATGTTFMRWAFDPAIARNAHFNLDTLGAVGIRFRRDLYGIGESDRLIVQWDFDSAASAAKPGLSGTKMGGAERESMADEADTSPAVWGRLTETADRAWITIPSSIADLAASDPASASTVRSRLADSLEAALGRGLQVAGCHKIGPGTARYDLVHPQSPATTEDIQ
ncbi:hypothetical protein LWF01_12600 [Saxibacter everestensis]|uniref:N-acetyltransferase domain-containing protein n=1 Tax=Saxibacter everestensis TaxID=2909229 RepID=A0ABY8QPN9_9MICO|nr:hypothetical protein LWF01_12600 [Brevibacteriaceae bacterium ZFBP1038]